MSTPSGKDVIYIDIDDEITAIIDKVRGSGQRIVALVLPKRATVLQSIVNMKLLKRTSDEAKKHLVLITSEVGLLPLAGAVGIYVAKSLQSKPEIPDVSGARKDAEDHEESVDMRDSGEKPLDTSRSVGEHSKNAPQSVAFKPDDEDQPIELDNSTPVAAGAATDKPKGKKDKKLSIPDFNKFRLWMLLGGVGLVLIVFLWFIAFQVMPRATISVKTDSEAIDTNIDLTLNAEADRVDVEDAEIPAKIQQTQKTVAQQAAATGQKDKGTKAVGSVVFYYCNVQDLFLGNSATVPAGTAVSTGGLVYVTTKAVSVPPSHFKSDQSCKKDVPSSSVGIVAQNAGDKYNIAPADYTVAGNSSLSGQGSSTAGGTSNIVKTITQTDIDSAKQKIAEQDTTAIKSELKNGLTGQGLFVIEGTFKAGDPEASTSAAVGDEAESVTVTAKTTYTMAGVKEGDLKKVIANQVNKEIDPAKQSILDYGLDGAVFKLQNQQATEILVTLQSTAVAGSDLDLTAIKKAVAGKKANDAKEIIGEYPGVTSVDVKYSPFWVSSIPGKTNKITISVEKPASKNAQ
ncbi:MAG TPA: hypothetical protein VFT16_04595 [Candidatus Saccharimonadales bacterium]|nr:hypothetical protein [Candidatus Saccharimonadales bacterium]